MMDKKPLAYKEFPKKELRQKYPNLKNDTIQVMEKCFYKDGLDKKTYRYEQNVYFFEYSLARGTQKNVEDLLIKEFGLSQDECDGVICNDYSRFSYYSLSWQ